MTALRSLLRNQAIFGAALLLVGLQTGPSAQEKQAPQGNGHTGAVAIQMRNVNLMLARDIVLEVRTLRGELQRTKPDVPVPSTTAIRFYWRPIPARSRSALLRSAR
jgi:hypothetical protein